MELNSIVVGQFQTNCYIINHKKKTQIKYLGNVQYKYEKKNWSSVMMFNNAKCKALTPEYVRRVAQKYLKPEEHRLVYFGSEEALQNVDMA